MAAGVPMVFPVRFSTGSTAVQTTTRELSLEGVVVRCEKSPVTGKQISLVLYLPGSREGVQLDGVVRDVRGGAEAGFFAEFVSRPPEAMRQIAETLERRERAGEALPIGAIALQPASDDPRRAFPRHSARFAVRFATAQDFVLEYAANISAGGVFVQTLNPPPLETKVTVELELPGAPEPVTTRAVVVHRVTPEEAARRGTLAGMGVQFADSDDAFRAHMDAAIEHILKLES